VPPEGFAVSVMPWPLATVGFGGVMEPALNDEALTVTSTSSLLFEYPLCCEGEESVAW
jgi:hypothetical protein